MTIFHSIKKLFHIPYPILRVRKGLVSITTVLVIGTVIMETALVGMEVAYLVGEQGIGVRASYSASAAAESGIHDVLLHIARNKDYVPLISPYTLTVGSYSTQVSVVRTNIDTRFSQYTITATGIAFTKRETFRSIVTLDGYTGAVSSQSFTKVSN